MIARLRSAARGLVIRRSTQPVVVPPQPESGSGEEGGIEVRVSRCPACKRYAVDRVGVSRADSCFNGHDTAEFEVVATIRGPLARVALDLNRIEGIQSDEEWLYAAKEETATGTQAEASSVLADLALEHLIVAVAPTQPLQGSEVEREGGPLSKREQAWSRAAAVDRQRVEKAEAKLQRVEEERDGAVSRSKRNSRRLERIRTRAIQAEARIEQAAKYFEDAAAEEKSRIPGADSKQQAEVHRGIVLALERSAELLRSQSSSEVEEEMPDGLNRCGGNAPRDARHPGCPDCKQEER